MKALLKRVIKALGAVLLFPCKFLVPKGDVIILQTFDRKIYADNTRYLYEYLSAHTPYRVYWVTDSEPIKQYLRARSWRYISRSNLLQYVWVALRAKIVIDSGDGYFNPLGLIGRRTIKMTTYHATGPKITATTFDSLKANLAEVWRVNRFDYVNFPSQFSLSRTGRAVYRLPKHKLINLGYPRYDMCCDPVFVAERTRAKPLTREVLGARAAAMTDQTRVLLFAPTWRPYEYEFPLNELPGFCYQRFDAFLKANDLFFFYVLHTKLLPKHAPANLERMLAIDRLAHPFFDTTLFLVETDLLVNDYSTTTTAMSLMRKPQVYVMPDFERYDQEKGFLEDYRAVIPGPEATSYDAFEAAIVRYVRDRAAFERAYGARLDTYVTRYYEWDQRSSCAAFTAFIDQLMGATPRELDEHATQRAVA